jgi:hypothetical protein
MTKQMPYLKKRFLSYRKFAEADFNTMFSKEELQDTKQYEADILQTVIFENLGNGSFKMKPLPGSVQFSTVNAILVEDFDNDKIVDLLMAGNFYPINIQMGRNDASCGLFLRGNGRGSFSALPSVESGFVVQGETRKLRHIMIGSKKHYLAFRNNDSIEVLTMKQP